MNITELKIKNAIYEFGLTDEQIETLKNSFSECKGQQGTTFIVRGNTHVFGIKFDNYDRTPIIVMKDNEDIEVLPTTIIGKWKLQYTPTKEDSNFIELLHDNIEDRRGYSSDDKNIIKANSTEQIKAELKDLIFNFKGDTFTFKSMSDDFVRALFWVFDKEVDETIFKDVENDNDIRKIFEVFEQDNIRLSLSKSEYGDTFKLMTFTPDDERYNYIDKGRFFLGKMYVWDDITKEELDESFLRKCGSKHSFLLVTADHYRHTKRKYKLKVQKEKEEQELKEQLTEEVEKRLENMTPDTEILINGIKFTGRGIIYSGQEITGTFSEVSKGCRNISTWGQYYNDKFDGFRNTNNLDFNVMFEQFCDFVEDGEFNGKLGSINVNLHREETETKNGNILTRVFINNIRINKSDVGEMLKRAICFFKVEDYNDLLKSVSKCNLQFHDLLSNGLQIKFTENAYSHSRFNNSDKIMKLIVVRKGNKNFLVVGDNEFQISDTNKLINRSIKNRSQRYTPTFRDLTALFKEMFTMNDDDLIILFRDGLKEYKQAVLRSEQFLKETLELFKVSEVEKDGRHGYLITGSSGQQYMLTKDLKIYAYPNMSYICIVDKDIGQGFTNDKIVNRIYALANDSRVAKDIYTLKPHATAGGEE